MPTEGIIKPKISIKVVGVGGGGGQHPVQRAREL